MNFLSSLGNVKDKLFKSNKQLIFIFILLAIFIGLAIYVYNNYIAGMLDPNYVENNEFVDTNTKTFTEVYFFHTNWCPHCKKAKPIWNQLKDKYDGKIIHDSVLTFKIVNGTPFLSNGALIALGSHFSKVNTTASPKSST